MRWLGAAVLLVGLAACAAEDGKPSFLGNTLCGMRESACKQRCEPMQPREALACRQSCEDSGKDKCG